MKTFDKIKNFLEEHQVHYEFKEHEEVLTSEDAARARGEDIKIGAKAMVLKADGKFVMCILSAALKIDSKKVKELLGVRDLRFATPEEVFEKTTAVPGGVPPFPNLFGFESIMDNSILENSEMAFNAGERTKSLKIKTSDYVRVMKPRIESFSALK